MKLLSYFLLLAAVLTGLWGCNEDFTVEPTQYSSVRGKVQFEQSRLPVKGASVRLSPTGRTIETDSTGTFRFDTIAAGRYTVQASLPGFTAEYITVEVEAERVAVVTINLRTDRSQNRPPNAPQLVSPRSGADSLLNTVLLKWTATDPNRDTLTYDVYLYREGSTTPTQSFTSIKADSVFVRDLQYSSTYYWQVFVRDGINEPTKGETWTFRTRSFPDLQYVYARRVAGQLQIFTSNSTGEQIQLTSQGSSWRPIYSPNRQRIAFISNREAETHLYVMDRDGSNLRRVSGPAISSVVPATELSFAWSPDGTQLLYPSNNRLYVVSATGRNGEGLRTVLTASDGRFFGGCDWTEQNNRIVARTTTANAYDNEIVLYTPEGAGYSARTIFSRKPGRTSNPVFSVDGREVLVSHDISTTTFDNGRQLDARIFRINYEANTQTDISGLQTQNPGQNPGQNQGKPAGTNDLEPRYSPNGARVIFTSVDNTGTGTRTIYAVDLNGQNRTQLIVNGENPDWR